jgi:DNA-binding beta-propeller fold protein YncE
MKRSLRLYVLALSAVSLIAALANAQNSVGGSNPPRSAVQGEAETAGPLTLIQTIAMLDVPQFPFTDHLAVDVKGHRLFATPQARKSVQVFDLASGALLHEIAGMGNPHSVLYRGDLDRIYISDGEPGLVRIYDGKDYRPLQTVKLPPDADNFGYDPATKYLYVSTSGAAEIVDGSVHLNSTSPKLNYSLLNVVDTTTGDLVGDIKIAGPIIEQMTLESSGPRIYINVTSANEIAVVDRQRRTVVARWPITRAKKNFSLALDETRHRLFVGCRNTDEHGGISGAVVVIDTQTGNEIEVLPIGGWVDNMYFDPTSGRLYASCGTGYVYVYRERDPDHFDLLGKAETALLARTGLLVPELKRYFASVPHIGSQASRVLVFQVN